MAFVKLDCGILDSTVWFDREAREIFITALLMAEPYELKETVKQIEVDSLQDTGFSVPPGWYGFIPAAGPGIIHRAGISQETGIAALKRLCSPEAGSRTAEFEGRRLIRIDGGYLALNFDKYRNKDHTTAERSRRYRERKEASRVSNVTSRVTSRGVTQAEAEAENTQTAAKASRIPSLEEWKAYAGEKYPDWPAGDAQAAWNHYESVGWRKGKTPIVKWKLCVSTCYQNFKARNGSPARPERPLIEVK